MQQPANSAASSDFEGHMRILLAEDDLTIAGHLTTALSTSGYDVHHLVNGQQVWEAGSDEDYKAIILDLGLPGLDGMTILKRWRKEGNDTPVLVLTARGSWMERVDGFDAGADDYLPKPFRTEELIVRLRALIRRSSSKSQKLLSNGSISLDESTMIATVNGEVVELSPLESRALQLFLHNLGKIVSPSDIALHVQGRDESGSQNAVEAMVARLRKKLGPQSITTRRGFGYYIGGQGD
jgi:two-component system, OmpR family, response regulator